MSNREQDNQHLRDIIPNPVRDVSLAEKIREKISFLKAKVEEAACNKSENVEEDVENSLEGADNGLYAALVALSKSIGETVEDNDELTKDILIDGKKGLHKEFAFGWVNLVKQGSPLQMTATLAHELAHHFTPPVTNLEEKIISETIAEGTAFIICDYYGLDISEQAFPYIAGYNDGQFTALMDESIETISTWMIIGMQDTVAKTVEISDTLTPDI